MANTLLDDMASDFADVMLNTNEFAETVTFYPAGGGASRSIVMHVNRTQSAEDGIHLRSDNDNMIVDVLKDSSNAKGGILFEEIKSGSRPTLVRDSDFNGAQPVPGRFVFSGDILGETPHSWKLRFIRQKPYRTGVDARRS